MDFPSLSEISLVLLVSFAIPFVLQTRRFPSLPGPYLRDYLPGGIIYPIYRNSSLFSGILAKLGDIYGDVFSLWLGSKPVIVTSIPEDVVQVMSSVEDFERPPEIRAVFEAVAPGGIFTMPVKPHRHLKRRLRDSFNHSMLKGFHKHMIEAIEELCESLMTASENGKEGTSDVLDISEFLSLTTFRVITNVAFGSNMSRSERLEFAATMNKVMTEMMREYMLYPIRQAFAMFGARNKLFEYKNRIDETCNKLIKKRLEETPEQKAAREPDILDTILSLEDHPAQTLQSITAEFGVGGSHTSNQMLAWCIYETCCHPKVMSKIEDELVDAIGNRPTNEPISFDEIRKLPYMMKVWKETCRMHPMGPFLNRISTKDITLKGSGIQISRGTNVLAYYQRCQTDPKLWKDPGIFKPERWGVGSERRERENVPPGAYLPFGIGAFSCPGRFLADYEGPLILAEVHRRFKFKLTCRPDEIRSCSAFVETPQFVDKERNIVMGVPVRVQRRLRSRVEQ